MELLTDLLHTLLLTARDLIPIILLFAFFQAVVIRQPIPNYPRILVGSLYVFVGLSLFLAGLEEALFPIGKIMAAQLTDPTFLGGGAQAVNLTDWKVYGWVYVFAAAIGFSTTIAEPSLIAVAFKASEVSGGSISQTGLRITVAIGVAVGISLGAYRIISGTPLYLYILVGYIIVVIQTFFAPKTIIPLAYDSGGVTTSTVTVPVVAALGLGLSASVPGRNPAIDGFGLIAFASLFPIIAVLGYGQFAHWRATKPSHRKGVRDEI
ncbi:MAG: DUF1538 domain-containing protein [Desulfobulbaceae bacterium]|nr:MAG: DUF1538 domain-containing protein [Desulfobulbaceae bacterium]